MPLKNKRPTAALVAIVSAVFFIFTAQISAAAPTIGSAAQKRASSGKARSLFIVEHTAPAQTAIGQAVPVNITVKAKADLTDVKFDLNVDKGLDMTSAQPAQVRGNMAKHASFTETVTVVPASDGVLYINIIASGLRSGMKTVAAVSIPINVGTNQRKALKNTGAVKSDATGKKVISMPAEEK